MKVTTGDDIRVLELGNRSYNCLKRAGIATVGELLSLEEDELLALPSFGDTSLSDVRRALARAEIADHVDRSAAGAAWVPLRSALEQVADWAAARGVRTLAEMADTYRKGEDALFPISAWEDAERALLELAPTGGDALDWHLRIADAIEGETGLYTQLCDLNQRESLAEIAREQGVSGEAVRRRRCRLFETLESDHVVAASLDALGSSFAAETIWQGAFGGIDPEDPLHQVLLAAVADRLCAERHGRSFKLLTPFSWGGTNWLALDAAELPRVVAARIQSSFDDGLTTIFDLREALTDLLAKWIPQDCGDGLVLDALVQHAVGNSDILVKGETVLDWSGSLAEKAVITLRYEGEAMHRDDLARAVVGDGNLRGVINQFQADDRVIPVGPWHYDLASRADFEFTTYPDAMAQMLENGPMSPILLERKLRHRYPDAELSSVSIGMNSTQHPLFVEDGGLIRLRTSEDHLEVKALCDTGSVVRVSHGPDRGAWAWRSEVDHDWLRGSAKQLPESLGVALGAVPGMEPRKLHLRGSSGRSVQLYWTGMSPTLGSLRDLLNELGAELGDTLAITLCANGIIDASVNRQAGSGSAQRLRCAFLIPDTAPDWESRLAFALGFDLPAGPSELWERIKSRNSRLEGERQFFEAVFPEFVS